MTNEKIIRRTVNGKLRQKASQSKPFLSQYSIIGKTELPVVTRTEGKLTKDEYIVWAYWAVNFFSSLELCSH